MFAIMRHCNFTFNSIFTRSVADAMQTASLRGIGGCTLDNCFLSLLISSKVCRSRTGISLSESLSRKSKTEVSEELLQPLVLAGTTDATAGATGTTAATGMLSFSSGRENKRLLGGRQTTFSRVSFGGLPADEPDCGVDVEAALSTSVYDTNQIIYGSETAACSMDASTRFARELRSNRNIKQFTPIYARMSLIKTISLSYTQA